VNTDQGAAGFPTAAPGSNPARSLAEITTQAMPATCGHCWARSGTECVGGEGVHLARFARARRRGLLTEADMRVVLDAAGWVSPPGTVVPGTALTVTS
jgi:hypothetical protein